jgi:hypothetical protein
MVKAKKMLFSFSPLPGPSVDYLLIRLDNTTTARIEMVPQRSITKIVLISPIVVSATRGSCQEKPL